MYRFNLSEDTLGGIGIDDIINKNLEIFLSDALQVINSAHSTVLSLNSESLESTDSGIHTGTVHGVTDGTGIGKERKIHTAADVILEDGVRIGINVVLEVTSHDLGNRHELISAVVGEINVVTD
eukprot:634187_1